MRANDTSTWRQRVALITLFSISIATSVSAQTSSTPTPNTEPRLTLDETVWRIDATGREGTQAIAGRSDSLWNGALIGAGVGLAAAIGLCRSMEPWENCRDDVGPMLGIAAIGAGAGIAIDALFSRRTTVSQARPGAMRLHAGPIVGRRTRGLRLSLRF